MEGLHQDKRFFSTVSLSKEDIQDCTLCHDCKFWHGYRHWHWQLTLNGLKKTTWCKPWIKKAVVEVAMTSSLFLLWYTKNDISEQDSWVLRFHSTAAAFFTLSWSRGRPHCHQLMHYWSVCSLTHIQHTAAVLALQQSNLFPVLSPRRSPRGTQFSWNTRLAACNAALPNPDPVASSAQMLWQRPGGGGPAGPSMALW